MSTDLSSETSNRRTFRTQFWTNDLRLARILRFSIGVTLSVAISFTFAWPLYFLTAVFTSLFLSLPLPAPGIKQVIALTMFIVLSFLLGLVVTLFLLPYPLIYIPVLGLILFHIYYLVDRGGPVFLVIMCLLSVLIIPMLGIANEALASMFSFYFAFSGFASVIIYFLSHQLFPDPPGDYPVPQNPGFQKGYSKAAALVALKSTAAVWPLAILFISFNWTSELLILIFAGIFSLSPELSKGRGVAIDSLTSTLIGGVAAVFFFLLITAVSEFHFFITLMFLTTLVFSTGIFTENKLKKYAGPAFIVVIVLVGSSMEPGSSALQKLIIRVLLLSATTIYIVAVMAVLDRYWKWGKANTVQAEQAPAI